MELVAAKRIGRETVTYVSNIYKYYLAYQMMVQGERGARRGEGGGREALRRGPDALRVAPGPSRAAGPARAQAFLPPFLPSHSITPPKTRSTRPQSRLML